MNENIIIGLSVGLALVIFIGIHVWLGRWVKFKMDESAIINVFKNIEAINKAKSTEAIAAATGIKVARVAIVCSKSPSIAPASHEKNNWQLATRT